MTGHGRLSDSAIGEVIGEPIAKPALGRFLFFSINHLASAENRVGAVSHIHVQYPEKGGEHRQAARERGNS